MKIAVFDHIGNWEEEVDFVELIAGTKEKISQTHSHNILWTKIKHCTRQLHEEFAAAGIKVKYLSS